VNPTHTRWLSADEQKTWRAFLNASRMLFAAVDGQLQQEAGIPHAYYEILVRLSEARDRSLRMSQLADASISSKSRLSHAVARLEERGWVERSTCPTDRRGQVARLTDTGLTALQTAAPGHVEQVRRLVFDALSHEQVTALRAISEAIEAGVEASGCPQADGVRLPGLEPEPSSEAGEADEAAEGDCPLAG
jgi:DNA-binding MarR family transcriptional regulator